MLSFTHDFLPVMHGLEMQSTTRSSSCPALQTLKQRVKNWLLGLVQTIVFKHSVLPRMKSQNW